MITPAATTLHAGLDRTAASSPAVAVTFAAERESLRLDELSEQSQQVAAALAAAGVRRGDCVGLLFTNEPDFLRVLFALSRLGTRACPLPLPTTGRDGYAARVQGMLAAAQIRDVVVSRRLGRLGSVITPAIAGTRALHADCQSRQVSVHDHPVTPDDDLIVQFTSGSTAQPKGVRLTHSNALACLGAIRAGIDLGRPGDRAGTWLPLFHDMGLFGTLTAVLTGVPITVWPPAVFVKDPARWLREMADGRHTACALPNFGYDYLVQAVPAAEVAGFDLSHWRVALNGAEPISAESVKTFLAHFEPAGLRPGAMLPVYGLAEATLAVTFSPLGRGPRVDWVDRTVLADERVAVPVGPASAGSRGVVALGRPVVGMDLRIADPESGQPLGERKAGEVQVRGPSVTAGYLNVAGEVEQPFTGDGWLRTGDLGYLAGGELYVTGRIKEMMIFRGVNYYPEDIESVVRSDPGVHRGRCVAFADVTDGREHIVLVVETAAGDQEERSHLFARLHRKITSTTGLDQVKIILAAPQQILRTSSGKLQRLASRGMFTSS